MTACSCLKHLFILQLSYYDLLNYLKTNKNKSDVYSLNNVILNLKLQIQ